MARIKLSADAGELEKLEWPHDWSPPWRTGQLVGHAQAERTLLEAHAGGRLHHAWLPDVMRVEPELVNAHDGALEALRRMGHTIASWPERQGDAHTIRIDPDSGEIQCAADRRISGAAAGY